MRNPPCSGISRFWLFQRWLVCAPQMTLAQRDFNNVEIIAHHVAGSVYYWKVQVAISGSVGEDGVVMIDDQFAPLTDKILAAIRR